MRDPGEEDDALVQAARNGDRHAFALLYHRYKLDVWNLAYLTLRNYHEAEDSVQETFVKALRALRCTSHVDAVRPWLLAICRNVCLDRLRAARRRQVFSLDDDTLAEPAAVPTDQEQRIDFHRALASLAPEDREAFMLVDVLGCRSHEAATILGLRASSTLRSRLSRARRQIAPAISEPVVPGALPQIWGVYHHPPDSAIVASFDGRARQADLSDLLATLDRYTEADAPSRNGLHLVEFLDRLEHGIPRDRRLIAVIDNRPPHSTNTTQHWLADHPRWQVRRPHSHESWLLEVKSLLQATGNAADERCAIALAALRNPTPFYWTWTHPK
jgi:RNA polymerase sigma-70 factor (ECF subfamily)